MRRTEMPPGPDVIASEYVATCRLLTDAVFEGRSCLETKQVPMIRLILDATTPASWRIWSISKSQTFVSRALTSKAF